MVKLQPGCSDLQNSSIHQAMISRHCSSLRVKTAGWLTILFIVCILSFSSYFLSTDWQAVISRSNVFGFWKLLAGRTTTDDIPFDTDSNNYHQCKSQYDFDRWNQLIHKRVSSLREQCNALGINDRRASDVVTDVKLLERLIVDTKHQVIYCDIPKVATTNWRRVFLWFLGVAPTPEQIAYDDVYNVYKHTLHKLIDFSANETRKMLQSYKKLVFVRHPFDRLASAFADKFIEQRGYFDLHFGAELRKFRRNTSLSLHTAPALHLHALNDTYSFDEFARYVLSIDAGRANEHWATYVELCQPCVIDYTVIGHFENLDSDIPCTLRVLLSDQELSTFVFPGVAKKTSATASRVASFYRSLTQNETDALRARYETDFKLFGYDRYLSSAKSK